MMVSIQELLACEKPDDMRRIADKLDGAAAYAESTGDNIAQAATMQAFAFTLRRLASIEDVIAKLVKT